MKRVIVALTTLALVGAGHTATADPALDWRPCAENAEAQCATLTVPIDWARAETGTIDVAVARRPARNQDAKIGTLVYIPGGPGGSGVNTLLRGPFVSPSLANRFDVVSLDPRGAERSHPVTCDASLVALPNLVPDTGGRLADVVARNKKLGASTPGR